MTFGDFQTLVAPENIVRLEAADRADVGLADIWLVQAFQGGRMSMAKLKSSLVAR